MKTAAQQFLAGGGGEAEGVTRPPLAQRRLAAADSRLYECNNLVALHLGAAKWADLLETTIVPVIDDGEAGPNLVAVFKK